MGLVTPASEHDERRRPDPPAPPAPEPDTKDWTWTLDRTCPDCGFTASSVTPDELPGAIADATARWGSVLARPGVRDRPRPRVWSPLEYACHVRDVCRLFDKRVRLMLTHDDPAFDNWDQDETAVRTRYDLQDPAAVRREIADAATHFAETYAGVSGSQWKRTGRRSDGTSFTVLTLGQYGLHDLVHHLWDVKAS